MKIYMGWEVIEEIDDVDQQREYLMDQQRG
jgi:hypothetical protein